MDSDDPKAMLVTLITEAETTGRKGDGKKIGKLGNAAKDRMPRGKSFEEPKGPRTPKPDTAEWEAGVLDLTTENFRLSVASPRPVLVWITTPVPPADAKDPESKERREVRICRFPP